MPFMYGTPCVNKCMKHPCFATCDERFAIDCTVTLYIQSKLLLFVCHLTLLGYDRVLEIRFGVVQKSWKLFCKPESGNPV